MGQPHDRRHHDSSRPRTKASSSILSVAVVEGITFAANFAPRWYEWFAIDRHPAV